MKLEHDRRDSAPHRTKAGVVMLIVLFSFGLLFNYWDHGKPQFPTKLMREEIPQVLPYSQLGKVVHTVREAFTHSSPLNSPSARETGTSSMLTPSTTGTTGTTGTIGSTGPSRFGGRTLLEFDETRRHRDTESPVLPHDTTTLINTETQPTLSQESDNTSYSEHDTSNIQHKPPHFMAEFANQSLDGSEELSPQMGQHINQLKVQPNTLYMTCDKLRPILSTRSETVNQSSPYYLSLLIPMSGVKEGEPQIVEVLTQIVDVSIHSHNLTSERVIPI